MMKKFFIYIFLLVLLISACAPAGTDSESPALFKIIKTDGTEFDVTVDMIKTLPVSQVTAEGRVEEGPLLKDVLALAGVTEFTEVSLTGSSSPATLTFEQVDENTILDLTNRGTLKLATTYIPKDSWTKDISEITVK
jgi:hypothetical protein